MPDDPAVDIQTDPWVPVYRMIAYRTACRMPPTEDVAVALVSFAVAQDLRDLYEQSLATILKDHTDVSPHLRAELDRLRRAFGSRGAQDDGRMLRGMIISVVRQMESTVSSIVISFLLERYAAHGWDVACLPPIATELAGRVGLAPIEQRVAAVLFCLEDLQTLSALVFEQSGVAVMNTIADLCDASPGEVTRTLEPGSTMWRLGLLTANDMHGRRPRLSAAVSPLLRLAFLSGSLRNVMAGLFGSDREALYQLEDFSVPEADCTYLAAALVMGKPVLLSGTPGVGKTEFAYALGHALQRTVRSLVTQPPALPGTSAGSRPSRVSLVGLAAGLMSAETELLLVDEADAVLQSAGGFFGGTSGAGFDKAVLNEVLDQLTVPSIWITNDIERVPPSSLRRFAHLYAFPLPDRHARERMLSERLRMEAIPVSQEAIRELASRYEVTPAAIDRMAILVQAVARGAETGSLPQFANAAASTTSADELAREYVRHAQRGPLRGEYRRVRLPAPTFDPDLCNADEAIRSIIDRIRARSTRGRGTRLLFHGPPGTGKTQAALYVAAALEREAVVRRPSDLLSQFVGEAEKAIAAMFRGAATEGHVLILDEADALLAGRDTARHRWELSQAAEFLQALQEFDGVLVACTNRLDAIDPALRRRFHALNAFHPLDPEQTLSALEHFFPAADWESHRAELASSGVPRIVASDIANAAELLADQPSASLRTIIDEIRAAAKSRAGDHCVIGFTQRDA